MPRQVRIEFSGATYHVMCRGDRREEIFRDDGDREIMLATLAETVEKTGWQVHAWVWMSNHYHLLVEMPEANLVKGKTWFQTTCTTRFNARHHQRGHLFCLRSQSRKNYHGDEIKAHGESEARALLAAGLAGAGIKAAELPDLPKSDRRTVIIATQIRRRTAVPLAWIAHRLHMGTPSNVSHACRRKSGLRVS